MPTRIRARSLFDPSIVRRAILDSFIKLDPRSQIKNPVMFVVFISAIILLIVVFLDLAEAGHLVLGEGVVSPLEIL